MAETDIRVQGAALYNLPVRMRMPLKFGRETMDHITCARAAVRVRNTHGHTVTGWGETPLSVLWVWPSRLSYEERHQALISFIAQLARAWAEFPVAGHPLEIGWTFQETRLPELLAEFNRRRAPAEPMPWLAALVCCSPFDIALHDAYGILHQRPVYETYNARFMNRDLAHYLKPADDTAVSFAGRFPEDYFVKSVPDELPVWHLVGGADPLAAAELTGREPADGYPVLLADWIRRDGLRCLKIKLRGNDAAWDYQRLVAVGRISETEGVQWLSADFNCLVTDPAYVNDLLDRLQAEQPLIYKLILYVEQPFPYDLEANQIDVHSVAVRKPLFMDESAHDWRLIKLGRSLGWNGVALKTCKTQTGGLLSFCWAKAHGLQLMVQDLTNPMLAMIPHALLAAHAGTIMGVESNAPQFYPEASRPEAAVHPGLYARRQGRIQLTTLRGPGFGYQVERIERALPDPVAQFAAD